MLQDICSAPLYDPSRWSWSFTLEFHNAFLQILQTVMVQFQFPVWELIAQEQYCLIFVQVFPLL